MAINEESGDIYYYIQKLDQLEKEKRITLEESERLLDMIFSLDNENTVMAKEIIDNLVTGATGTTKP